jgi:phage terminase large subunit-like protein
MISNVVKRNENGEVVIDMDAAIFKNYPRSRSRLPQAAQQYIWFDVDQPVEKEVFDKRVNRICYSMLCIMGTILTVGFVIIITTILKNKM